MSDQSIHLRETIPDALAGLRLDQALARMFPEYSRSRLKSWILAGLVTVDGAVPKPRDVAPGGGIVALEVREEKVVHSAPEPIALNVAFEDEELLIINKPVGLVVHPGAGNHSGTLMNGLLHHAPQLEKLPRAGIVHRLDKDTSGLMMVAKTLTAHTALVRQLAEREISRNYLAICYGVLTGGGTVDAPIGRHPVDRLRMHVTDGGKAAVTHYRVLQRFAAHTYIRVSLETGRTHQIRVHFAHRRNPLVGDQTYGRRLAIPAGASESLAIALRDFRRQALHAEQLTLQHPASGEELQVAAEPPADFQHLLAELAAGQ